MSTPSTSAPEPAGGSGQWSVFGWLGQRLASRRLCLVIVGVCLGLVAVALDQARSVEHADDILAFLPHGDPDVQAFREINSRFGGLEVALVGIRTDDVFAPDFLRRLVRATEALDQIHGIAQVLSLTNVVDFMPDEERGGIVTGMLVDHVPLDATEQAALRELVMSRDAVVSNLISADGTAVLLYCFLGHEADPRTEARNIRAAVREIFPDTQIYWGGAPFVSGYIYDTTQADLHRLTPWAVLAIILVILLSFRDLVGAFLALLTTGMGIVLSLGTMAALGIRFNIVLSSMPVILFALGSAYGIHLLSRYYLLVRRTDPVTALARTLRGIGPPVFAAGLTTAVSLLSFVAMNIEPLQTFGLFTALGILATLILSLTFLPAVVRLLGLRRKRPATELTLRRLTVRLCVGARRRRGVVGAGLALVAAVGLAFAGQVNTAVDETTFYSPDSPPDRAAAFLREYFGGGVFLQVEVSGDLSDPLALRELQRIGDRLVLLPHTADVLHVGQVVARANEAMTGQRRVPDTAEQVKMLYTILTGDPAVSQLISTDRRHALLQLKLDTPRAAELEQVLDAVEAWIGEQAVRRYRRADRDGPERPAVQARIRTLVADRIQAAAHAAGLTLDRAARGRLEAELQTPLPPVASARVAPTIRRFLRSEECAVELPDDGDAAGQLAAVAAAVAALGPAAGDEALLARLAEVLEREPTDPLVDDLALSLSMSLDYLWQEQRAAQRADRLAAAIGRPLPTGRDAATLRTAWGAAVLDLGNQTALLPATADGDTRTLEYRVSGQPVVHRGLSRSAARNQIASLAVALVLVVLVLAALFRSFWAGVLTATPTLLTLAVIYGGMGALGVHLDIGTAMLASLILGAGVDYAVHTVVAWRALDEEPRTMAAARAADRVSPAVWTNAVMVGVGFFVLTLGEARPLQNVGSLTSAAMFTAALATFLTLPVLARRRRYLPLLDPVQQETSEVVKAVLGKDAAGSRPD